MTETTTWMCRVVGCRREAVAGWGDDVLPSVDVCSGHLQDLAGGALAFPVNGGRNLRLEPLQRV